MGGRRRSRLPGDVNGATPLRWLLGFWLGIVWLPAYKAGDEK